MNLYLEDEKRWGEEFDTPRASPVQNRIPDLKKEVDPDGDIFEFVFNNSTDIEDPEAPGECDDVIELCRKIRPEDVERAALEPALRPEDLENPALKAALRRAAWVDDRRGTRPEGLGRTPGVGETPDLGWVV